MPYKTGLWGEQAKLRDKNRNRIGKNMPLADRKKFLDGIELFCEICGITHNKSIRYKSLLIHHKDGDITNNFINNLMLLCRACHNIIHKTKNKEQK